MQILTDIFVTILTGYLAFSNGVAERVTLLAGSVSDNVAVEQFAHLPSSFASVPDVLRNSTKYQAAAVTTPGDQRGATVDEPVDAIVNILCTLRTEDYVRTTTGTGFFVDPDGVIMTNAHVAQFLLLEETDSFGHANCMVRSGNPAIPTYMAELLYISPTWVLQNAALMTADHPTGTGEKDYALLYVSQTMNGEPLPASFPALTVDPALLPITIKEQPVTAAGYPATDFLRYGPQTDLIPKQDETTVSELYTFGSNYADVFSIRGSEVGAEGSSGGPVVNESGEVIGMIVTRGDDSIDGEGSLRAITTSHIARSIEAETGLTLEQNFAGDLPFRGKIFTDTMTPFLITLLERAN